MDLEKTNISYDEKIWMYKVDYGFYTKYFDCFLLYYKDGWIKKIYWEPTNNIVFEQDFDLDNYAIWLTKMYDKTIVCLIDLDNFYTKYFIVKTCYFYCYTIKNKKYLFFIYTNENWDEKLFHNCYLDDIEISFVTNTFQNIKTKCEINIINKVLWIEIFKKNVYLYEKDDEQIVKTEEDLNLSIIDLYFFDDYFYSLNHNFKLFDIINNKIFKVWNNCVKIIIDRYNDKFYPNYKISFYIDTNFIDKIDLKDIIKVFLSFYPKQYLLYSIDNINIKRQLEDYFLKINNLNFDEIDLDFSLPENIFQFDENFTLFQENLNKLKYIYFNLKNSLNSINNNLLDNKDNLFIEATKIRLDMNKQSIELTIQRYEKMLTEIFTKIKTIIW